MKTLQTTTAIPLKDVVLPYAGALTPEEVGRLAEHAGGAVLSGRRSLSTIRRLRALGHEGLLLVDPAVYVPRADQDEADGPPAALFAAREDWIREQEEAGVNVVLTPSPLLRVGDTRALAGTIAAGNEAAKRTVLPVVTVLGLPSGWLRRPHLDDLIVELDRCSNPVAFALGHSNDPLGTEASIGGLLNALAAKPGSGLIRTDIAALGALAHGAPFGAIGLGTTQRHFVPPPARPGGNREDRSVRLFVPGLMTYRTANLLGSVAGRDREGVLRCHCDVCRGTSLERFEDDRLRPLARVHDVLAWRNVADKLLSIKPTWRRGAWRQMCHEAIERHAYLEKATNVSFPVPSHLRAWERFSSFSS